MPKGDSLREFLLSTLNAQVAALAKYQDESGLWHTLINDSNSYLESSATAGFAYGILKAVHKNIFLLNMKKWQTKQLLAY